MCAPTTCRKPARRRCRSSPSRSPPPSRCSTASRPRTRSRRATFGEVVGRISFFVNAGLRFITEICKMRAFTELWDEITRDALRRQRSEAAAVPLRRAGQLARADRAAAGEQRHPHPDRDAGGDALQERARARRAASGLERGARPAAAVGSAMVAAHAADPGLRNRPAGIWRHIRRLAGDRRQGRRAQARCEGRAGPYRGAGRRGRGGRAGLHEAAAGRIQHARASRRSSAASRPWSGSTASSETEASPLAGAADAILTVSPQAEADQIERLKAWRAARDHGRRRSGAAGLRAAREEPQHHAGVDRLRQSGRDHRRMGLCAARKLRRIPRADRRRPRRAQRDAGARRTARRRRPRVAASSAGGSNSCSASPASTAIPTAPSRSRCARAMPAWTWSMTASGSRRRRSWTPRASSAPTWSGSRSCPARTCRWSRRS